MSVETLTEQILLKIPTINKCRRDFMTHLFIIWLSLRGRHNYTNIARYGLYREETYRTNASRPFDFLQFNRLLAKQTLSTNLMLAFDPTYISKSGKCTKGVGYFYSGCAGRVKWGLEFSGIAAIDLSTKNALHLEAVQTLPPSDKESLLTYYARILVERKTDLQALSKTIVADAFFARAPFVLAVTEAGFELVTRLQKNTHLRYLYKGPKRKGRGRPKQYDGQVNPRQLRKTYFKVCAEATDGSWIAYEAVVNARAWKRSVTIVLVHHLDKAGQIKSHRIFASTDIAQSGKAVKQSYESRFQIEFLFRDAKGQAGLEHCQARSKEKLHFHVNTALTVVSLAKAAHYLSLPKEQQKGFSIADVKTLYINNLFFNRIISLFGFSPNLKIIQHIKAKVIHWGFRNT